jgi:hypothetical protein
MGGREIVLAGMAGLFLAFLLWQMRPGGSRRRALGAEVRAARERARAAATPSAKAEALCQAGAIAVRDGARWTSAAGSYLRAMKADPTSTSAVTQLVTTFRARRPRLLEKILWRRLGHLPWDAAHWEVLVALASSLRQLYERERRDRVRARVFGKLEAALRDPSGFRFPPSAPTDP